MAKNKIKIKNMKLEQNELSATTIGVFENRKKSSIGVFVLLGIFVAVVFYLPEVTEFIDAYLNPVVATPPSTSKPNEPVLPPSTDDEPNYNNEFYTLSADLKIEREDIVVSQFVVDNLTNKINFVVTNALNKHQSMEALNYYLELYSEEQTLLERVKITGDKLLASGAFVSYTKNILANSASSVTKVALVKKNLTDYPAFDLKSDDTGMGTLVCSNNHEKVTYKFKDSLLKEVVSEVSYLSTDANYMDNFLENKNLSNSYNNQDGIVSIYMDYESGYKVTTNVNLSEAGRLYIYSADTFKLDTAPNVVNFEMEAQGFSCE